MRNLRQQKLSFTPTPKKIGASSLPSSAQIITPSTPLTSTPRLKKSRKSSAQDRIRGAAMDCVEILSPPKRALHSNAHYSRSSSTKAESLSQARKQSLKRKLSPLPDRSTDRSTAIVHLPYHPDNATSSLNVPKSISAGQSSRQGPLLSMDNIRATEKRNGPAPLKKLRLSSPLSDLTPLAPSSVRDTDQDDFEIVPTSQSDEQELVIPRFLQKDHAAVQKSVDIWRKETFANPPSRAKSPSPGPCYSPDSELSELPIFDLSPSSNVVPETPVVDAPPTGLGFQYPRTPCSATGAGVLPDPSSSTLAASDAVWATPASHFVTPSRENGESTMTVSDTSPSGVFRSLTPPPSSPDMDTDAAPIVRALNVESKTDMIIANIKARAQAAARSNPEPPVINLDALSDSDSDSNDEFDVAAIINGTRGKGKDNTVGASVSTNAGPSNPTLKSTPRYNLRRASPSSLRRKFTTPLAHAPKPRKANPLDVMLREKTREERTGSGMAAVRMAEEAVAKAKADMQDEMDDEENSSENEMDWEYDRTIARIAKGKGKSKTAKAGSSQPKTTRGNEDESDDDNFITQMHFEEILGKKNGEAVGKILADDQKEKMAKSLAKQTAESPGVPLWAIADCKSDMVVEAALPLFTVETGGSALLQMLKEATARNDVDQVAALLMSGFVAFLNPEHWPVVIPWLFDTAFSNVTSLATPAYTQLLRLAPLVEQRSSGLHLSYLLSILIRLGASSDVLRNHGCTSGGGMVLQQASESEWKEEMVYRLIAVIGAFAETFLVDDLCDILLVTVLLGMDPTTSDALRTDVRTACDSLARTMSPFQELAVCKKIVAFGRTISPTNQSLLISLIPGTSPATARMARCIARSLLTDTMPSSAEYSGKLPDLSPLVKLLSPHVGSGGHFDILGSVDKEGYYDELTCRVSLLSRVLSGIDEYTVADILERRAQRKAPRQEEDEAKEQEKDQDKVSKLTVLEQITRQLDLLHGKIVDTRAAHLDRSRAKAALQRLSSRVHYQRMGSLHSGVATNRPPTLLGYFRKRSYRR